MSDEWATPQPLFDRLKAEFGCCLDPCANDQNYKCSTYFTKREDGLKQDWSPFEAVFMNPPYGVHGRELPLWTQKAANAGTTVVALLPVRTDQLWWHRDVLQAAEIRWMLNRVYFLRPDGKALRSPSPPPLSSGGPVSIRS